MIKVIFCMILYFCDNNNPQQVLGAAKSRAYHRIIDVEEKTMENFMNKKINTQNTLSFNRNRDYKTKYSFIAFEVCPCNGPVTTISAIRIYFLLLKKNGLLPGP
uniref:Uncharacterized protein n=1 Tax=Glossina brevipalpis TaxID=37001 RepID=A0A1A9WZN4_9MUSC